MRWSWSVLVVMMLVGGCESAVFEPDGGGRDSGAVDASSLEDAGTHRHDASAQVDASARDAGAPDAGGRDAGSDPADAGPPVGACWVIPQGGCAEGEACHAEWTAGGRDTYCATAGPLGDGECIRGLDDLGRERCLRCTDATTGRDLCLPGLACFDNRCRPYCQVDADCPPLEGRDRRCAHIAAEDPLRLGFCSST